MKKIPVYERSICIFANERTKKELEQSIDWKETALNQVVPIFAMFRKFNKLGNGKISGLFFEKKEIPYPIFSLDDARQEFKFQPSHPQNGFVYATSEIDELTYVPLASFHKYMYESKMAAFTKLCSSLGAKSCKIIYAEENGRDVTAKVKLENIPTNIGVLNSETNFSSSSKKTQNLDLYMSFPKNNNIQKFESAWMNGEPTWEALQEIRLGKDIEKYTAEFNYTDDMGVTLNVANSLNSIGVNIGGSYKEFDKIKYKFEVEFWPK